VAPKPYRLALNFQTPAIRARALPNVLVLSRQSPAVVIGPLFRVFRAIESLPRVDVLELRRPASGFDQLCSKSIQLPNQVLQRSSNPSKRGRTFLLDFVLDTAQRVTLPRHVPIVSCT
jgi:hypothetical protein